MTRSEVRPRWRWADLGIAAVLVVLAVVGAARWLDTTARPVIVLQTAGPFVAIGLLGLLVATAVLRRWWMLLPVTVAVVVAATIALPGWFAHTSPGAPRELTVMTINLYFGRADPDQVAEAVRAHSVDVLVATELTPEAELALDASGLDEWFIERAGEARPDSSDGTMVYSRFPITEVTGTDPVDAYTPSVQPEVIVDVSGTPVRVKAVHVTAPTHEGEQWRAGLRALATWRDRQGEQATVLVGDFNASQGHPAFRSLVEEGLEDAHRVAGLGWVRAWPFGGRRVPPYVQLDHLLTRGLSVIEAGQVAIHGTDHAIIWGAYSLPSR
ncbi:MAG TPA: endonuclease/exonuclease/phosphatase family protein [Intrasporangium sp.]|uniref:endonuclease/exonuclease/phosphatase family protein n=1 Tax=Intrasporangium sp. TaxID=1925024 RepID=UPI002B45A1EB|nr:endonuclease/exonuclease/phosphatase family protein [Intrasporangium sp.]HKX66749.1 endonuclease/exonuclease/phosphatase family protein [Intrasporangium sp.]